jgi:peptide-methionine (S)-S-oxide reductase
MSKTPSSSAIATFAAGCFWGVEEIFRTTPGVVDTAVGYTGGTMKDPTYQDVCTGETGHSEAVQVTYDPQKISYEALLKIFWDNHNPTTRNAQGPDIGSQYRSAIFTHSPQQETAAKNSLSALDKAKKFPRPIVTQILPATTFYAAEEYHQKYLMKRGMGSCHI